MGAAVGRRTITKAKPLVLAEPRQVVARHVLGLNQVGTHLGQGPWDDKAHSGNEWPSKTALLSYFREVRAMTKDRLEHTREEEFDRAIADEHFGSITVRQVWGGVVTSCAWHGGQMIFIANRLLGKATASASSS